MENEETIEESDSREVAKYPPSIPLIVFNEFCEGFNFFGLRTILVIYLKHKLEFEERGAVFLFHSFISLVFFASIFGAIIADSFWGKFKTIVWLSFIYVVGNSVVFLGAVKSLNMNAVASTLMGLLLIAIGSGGIKPCIAAFGGEQFTLPEQYKQLITYFSLYYFAINSGALISIFMAPLLHADIACFSDCDCFPAAFGLPAALLIISTVAFILGKPLYQITPSRGNMIVKVCSCIWAAIKTRRQEKSKDPKTHWLDYAEPTHSKKLVDETKILLNVLILYLPLPLFWALFDQQGSRWTFQASRMNATVLNVTNRFVDFSIKIKPEQMQIFNPSLILLLIPLFDYALYPLLRFCGLRRPLQKMAFGGILAGCAFLLSMGLEMRIKFAGPNKIHILWQLPQYFVMTLGEVMFAVAGLEFSFTQAPQSMKSVIQACWLLTVAFGNLLVIIIVAVSVTSNQAHEFLLFAILMFIDMGVFMWLSYRFKPIPLEKMEN